MVAFNPMLLAAYGVAPAVVIPSQRFIAVADQSGLTPGYSLVKGDAQETLYTVAATLPPFASNITGVAFSPDGTKLAVTAFTATNGVTIYDITTNPPTLIVQKNTPSAGVGKANDACWSPDSRFLAVGYSAGPFFAVFDSQASYGTLTLPGTVPNASVTSVAWNAQGTRLLVNDSGNTQIAVYSLSGTTLAFVSNLAQTVAAPEIRMSSDGTVLIAACTAGTGSPGMNTWTVTSSGTVFTKNTDPAGANMVNTTINGCAINNAKTLVAAASTVSPFIYVWDYPAMTLHANPGVLPSNRIWDLAFTEDDKELLMAGQFGASNLEGYTVSGMTHFTRTGVLTANSNFGFSIRVLRLGYALFAAGLDASAKSAVTDKYLYSSSSVSSGTVLTNATGKLAGVGTSTLGVFGGGDNASSPTAATQTYTYSGDVVAAGTNLGQARDVLAAAGNSTVGIFGGGFTASDGTTFTDKYTYSGAVVANGTVLGTKQPNLAACGNTTLGIFVGGFYGGEIGSSSKYTYSGNTVGAGGTLTTARDSMGAVASTTIGYIAGGEIAASPFITANLDKFTLSSTSVAAGTALGTARMALAGAGCVTFGIFAGGVGSGPVVAVSDKYVFSSDTVTSGTALSVARQYLAATSSAPGSF